MLKQVLAIKGKYVRSKDKRLIGVCATCHIYSHEKCMLAQGRPQLLPRPDRREQQPNKASARMIMSDFFEAIL
jgi:hypothetical protein